MFNTYPYTDFHELNLDWFLDQFKELVSDWDTFKTDLTEQWEQVSTDWQTLYDYVHDYFDNLDVQTEIDNKLDEMAADGSLLEITRPVIITTTGGWLADHITNPSNPPIDTSLSVSGAAADSKITGTRIRHLDSAIYDDNALDYLLFYADHNDTEHNGITFAWDHDANTCHISGTSTSTAFDNMIVSQSSLPAGIKEGDVLRFKFNGGVAGVGYHVFLYPNTLPNRDLYLESDHDLTIPVGCVGIFIRLEVQYNITLPAAGIDVQLKMLNTLTNAEIVENLDNYIESDVTLNSPELFIYSDLEHLDGWWYSSGIITGDTVKHSQPLYIAGATELFLGYLNPSTTNVGAFLDIYGNFISTLSINDVSQYIYDNGNIGAQIAAYADMYHTTSIPENAAYFSYNLSVNSALYNYREYVSNIPVFVGSQSGDYVIYKGDMMYQENKKKKVCVIGPSTAMINRMYISDLGQYLIGWQEYIRPFINELKTAGASGASWKSRATGDQGWSLYDLVVGDSLDLDGYDTYIFMASNNTLLPADSLLYTDTAVDTYFGGLKGTINYILTSNPQAQIVLTIAPNRQDYYINIGYADMIDRLAEQTKLLAADQEYLVIDERDNIGFNERTFASLTYDNTHYNQAGSKAIGYNMRHKLLNI